MHYTCKIYILDNSDPCNRVVMGIQDLVTRYNLSIAINVITVTDEIALSEGINRVPVIEVWHKSKMLHYHVGVLSHKQLTELLWGKLYGNQNA